VTYISRKFLKHEMNYWTVEKECLATKWALTKLKYYLLGRKFTLITDHAPLRWMSTAKDTNARVTRWFLELQNFNFSVEHRSGKAMEMQMPCQGDMNAVWSTLPAATWS